MTTKSQYKVSGEFTTPFGHVAYKPSLNIKVAFDKKLNRPAPNDNGAHTVSVSWAKDSADGKAVFKKMTDLNNKAHKAMEAEGDFTKKALPIKEKDGTYILEVTNSYEAPSVKDMNNAVVPPTISDKISTGSVIRAKMFYKEIEGFGKSGIKLYLKAVQVKELVEYTGGDNFDNDDSGEGGFSIADADGLSEADVVSDDEPEGAAEEFA